MPSRVSSRTFVGRDEERRSLSAALDAARQGEGGFTLIVGDAGVGKTRLVGELAALAGTTDVVLGTGACAPLSAGSAPYAAVAAAFDDLWSKLDVPTRSAVAAVGGLDLVQLLPALRDQATGLADDRTPDLTRTALFDAVARALERASEDRATCVVFEDVHWADGATLDLIGALARSRRLPRTALVATYRSDHVGGDQALRPWLAEIQRLQGVVRLDLSPFDADDVASLVAGITGAVPSAAVVDAIVRRSGGNAFFVEELIVAGGNDGAEVLPPSLRDVLVQRLDALDPATRQLVDAVAVVGAPVHPTLLAPLLDESPDRLSARIRHALVAQVIRRSDPVTEEVDVRHALIREAAYGELLPGERRRWHEAVAATLASADDPGTARRAAWWGARAVHAQAADQLADALVASVEAGRAAAATAAFGPALTHAERALALWDDVPAAEDLVGVDRAAILAGAAESADFAGHPGRSQELFAAAVEALGLEAPPTRRAAALLDLASASTDDDYALALASSERANALIKDEPPSRLRARAESCLSRELGATQEWPAALEMADRSLRTALVIHDPASEAVARARLARCFAALERDDEAEAEADRAIQVQRISPTLGAFDLVFNVTSRVFEGLGAWRRAADVADEGRVTAVALGLHSRPFDVVSAWYHFQIGERETTDAILAEHAQFAVELDERFHRLSALVDAHAGRHASALAHLVADQDATWNTASMVRADVAIWTGRPGDAIREARVGLDVIEQPYDPENWRPWLLRTIARAEADLADTARRRGRKADATAAADRSTEAHVSLCAFASGPLTYRDRFNGELGPSVLQAGAEAARARGHAGAGDWAPAAEGWRACAEAWGQFERPGDVAYARWREGEAWLRTDDGRATARDRLSEAAAIARRIGAQPIVDAVEGLAGRARLRLDAPTRATAAAASPSIGSDLTPRELEVLALLCQGASNRQLAESLFITENTAGVHVSNILGKLDVRSRTEAVAVAHLAGLVRLPST